VVRAGQHLYPQTRPQRQFGGVALGSRGIKQAVGRDGEHVAAMRPGRAGQTEHVGRGAIGPGDVAIGVQADQTVAGFARDVARPVQTQQHLVRQCLQQRVFDAQRRLCDQVLERRPFDDVDAGQVQHAHAATVGAEQRGTGTAVGTGVVKEMFATVQPHRLQLGERGADGGGAHCAFGQVHTHPRDQVGQAVVVVDGAIDIDDHTLGIGEDGEVAAIGHGPGQRLDHRSGGLNQRPAGLERLARGARGHRLETHALSGVFSHRQAAPPGPLDG
jgi:hypothetical protein